MEMLDLMLRRKTLVLLEFRKATCDLTPGNKVTILFSESFPLSSDD